MSRWSRAVELSWVTAGQGGEVIWWTGEGSAAKTSVQKCCCPLLTFLTSVILLTLNLIIPLPSPHPSPASALLDNTPSIWRWRTTHTCTVKTTSIRERTVLYLLWVLFFSFCLVFSFYMWTFVHLFFFYTREFVLYYVLRPSKLGWEVKGRDSCVRIGVWRFSYRAKANLTKTHVHANVNPHRSWWGTHGITLLPLSKTH